MSSSLAQPDEPYVTARGKIVLKNEQQEKAIKDKDRFVPVIRRMNINNKRNLNDMPCSDPSTQMAINVIMMYHLLGLTPNEISHVTKVPLDQVQDIQWGVDYQNTFELIFAELISVNTNSVKAKIAAFSSEAVDNIITLANEADKDIVKLKANQDILDRAGFAAEQLYESSSADDSDVLKIVMENDTGTKTSVEINLKGSKK